MTSVLLVDDEPSIIKLARLDLEREGFRIDSARDGEAALEKVAQQHPALVVLDVMLPGVSGHDLCRELRANGVTSPVLMLTARYGDDEEVHALDTGADDFLSKPFSYAVLLARLRALTRRGRFGASAGFSASFFGGGIIGGLPATVPPGAM